MNLSPQEREHRHEFLCREIERLIERHKVMPTDELKSRVSSQITLYVRELDEMEKFRREESAFGDLQESSSPPFGLHGVYPAVGAGVLCTLLGVLFGMSILTLGGLLVLLAAVSSLSRGRPRRAAPSGRNWEWKP